MTTAVFTTLGRISAIFASERWLTVGCCWARLQSCIDYGEDGRRKLGPRGHARRYVGESSHPLMRSFASADDWSSRLPYAVVYLGKSR